MVKIAGRDRSKNTVSSVLLLTDCPTSLTDQESIREEMMFVINPNTPGSVYSGKVRLKDEELCLC